MKVKIATWADLLYIFTFLYILFVVIIYCVDFSAELQLKIFNLTFEQKTVTIAQFWSASNESLKGFKFTLLIAGCGVIAFLLDRFILIPFLTRYTKAGKIEREKLKEQWIVYKENKLKKKGEKTKDGN